VTCAGSGRPLASAHIAGNNPVMTQHVFLLRGIGPASHRIMTMKALEAACHAQGLPGTRNLLATGNLVVTSDRDPAEIEVLFARAMASGGLAVTWQRRTGAHVRATADAARALPAFAEALQIRPARVQLHFLPAPIADAALHSLQAFTQEARVARAGAEVIIDYGASIGASPLTLARIDKALGRAQTARNWNTIGKIEALL
jgi:uncharacterized protein (DUF1697 family)